MTDTDTESSANDETAPHLSVVSDTATTDGGSDAPADDSVESETTTEDGVFVSQEELNDLGEFLNAMKEYVLAHEGRLTVLEGVIAQAVENEASKVKGIVGGLSSSIKSKP